jgi:hypothetical protein
MATESPRTILRRAILAAFKPESLTQLLAESLNRKFTDLVPNAAFDTQVFQLIDRADDEGWLGDLVDAMLKAREGNPSFVATVRPLADTIRMQGLASAMGPKVSLDDSRLEVNMGGAPMSAILAFIFGIIFVTALLALVIFIPNPTLPQFEVIRIILALAAGGVAAMIPGFLNLKLGVGTNLVLRAGGALAVFAIVYFYSPAHWASTPAQNVTQTTSGANSPAIIGNNNAVNAPGSAVDKSQ